MMRACRLINGQLCVEDVALTQIAVEFGTPCYVYSRSEIESRWYAYDEAFRDRNHLICYAVKANGNLAILNLLARLGSGFDIVSGGELQRVIKAGGDPGKTVFSGVGKRAEEIADALAAGIRCFNVESRQELKLINAIAGDVGVKAPVSIRVNPDVDAETHPYISTGLKENKFGISYEEAEAVFLEARDMDNLELSGIDCHIGSQITSLEPFKDAVERISQLIDRLAGLNINLRHVDVGGGLGVTYQDEQPPAAGQLVDIMCSSLAKHDVEILIEPGRSIEGGAGFLLTRLLYIKKTPVKNFAVVDAAMNDLIRPVLYDAWQEILVVDPEGDRSADIYDVVGPVCETADYLGLDRNLNIREGDLLAVCDVGAYGFAMSSNYNTRPRAAEVMVDGSEFHEIRRREHVEDLYRGETILPK